MSHNMASTEDQANFSQEIIITTCFYILKFNVFQLSARNFVLHNIPGDRSRTVTFPTD